MTDSQEPLLSEPISAELVPPCGPLDCKIAFVGEAPGETEVYLKTPFVGHSGQLLDRHMRAAGIARPQCYITNVIKERPPNNDIKHFIDFSKSGFPRTPAYDAYIELLKRELAECKANVLVAVGGTALYALTGKASILKWRNSTLESTLLPGRKVVGVLHPAACLRQYTWEYLLANDLRHVVEEGDSPEINLPRREIIIDPSYEEVCQFLSILDGQNKFSFDIECSSRTFQVTCISFAYDEAHGISIPFVKGGNDRWDPNQESCIWRHIARLLEDPNKLKVGQNVIFDCGFLFSKYGIRTTNVHCTMVAQGLIYPDYPKGLDFITSIYTKEPYYKDDGKLYMKYEGSERDFWIYNAKDSLVTLEAYNGQMDDMRKLGNVETYKRQCGLIPPLLYIQEHGIRMDVEGLKTQSLLAEEKIEAAKKAFTNLAGRDINLNSPKQLSNYFYVEKGYAPYFNKGSVTTDDDALKRLAIKGCEEAILLRESRKWFKLKSTYLDVQLTPEGRLCCSMNPIGTVTGRPASSKNIFGYGTNLLNQPPEMKQMMIPDEGFFLVNIDLSQAENRIVAVIAPEPTMIAAFDSGRDIHKQTASLLFNVPYEEVTADQRQDGKQANHSLNYGLGYKKFALRYEMPENRAKTIVEKYHKIYPGVRQSYHRWVKEALYSSRTLTNSYGRRRMFFDRLTSDLGTDVWESAFAHTPQSTVADKMNDAVAWMHREIQEIQLLNYVYDSVAFQVPLNIGTTRTIEILRKIVTYMETPIPWKARHIHIPADVKIGWNLGDVGWDKENSCETNPRGLRKIKLSVTDQQLALDIKERLKFNLSSSPSY